MGEGNQPSIGKNGNTPLLMGNNQQFLPLPKSYDVTPVG
jgi:hypothetical protein